MIVCRTKRELRRALDGARDGSSPSAPRRVGLVPTMGFLHDGHVSLLEAARRQCEVVVMSLFVNPTQFGPGEDLEAYPRDESRDLTLAEAAGVDAVYAPAVREVYPDGFSTTVRVSGLTEPMEGSGRGPSHFDGVATVVAKLLNTVGPDVAYFGQKDAQQAATIRRMAADLDFPVEIAVMPTVREPDGLAMSSRNTYLAPEDRRRAPALWQALETVRDRAPELGLGAALQAGRERLTEAGIEPEYLEARDADSLEPVAALNGRPVLVAVAARVGPARLIDNLVIDSIEAGKERR